MRNFFQKRYDISIKNVLNRGESLQIFTKKSFVIDSFAKFKERVDRYIAHKNRVEVLMEYKYIYYYYRKKKKVVYAQLNTIKKIEPNKYYVELSYPKGFSEKEINSERYYISVRNEVEILTLYFVLGRGYADNSKVHGIGLGISHQGGLVEATKEILTKNILSDEEKERFYLSANESEYLLADEILLHEIYARTKEVYINKLNNKLNNLATFVANSRDSIVLKSEVSRDPYLTIFYKTIIALNEISKKIPQEQYFFIHRRRPVMKTFFRTIANRKDSQVIMVYPIFKSDSVLFDKNDEESKKFLDVCVELLEEGLEIYMIFIIKYDFKITKYLKRVVLRLMDSGIKIKMAYVEDLDKLRISSYDFIFSKERDVAVYTSIRDRIRMFKVTKTRERIEILSHDLKKIENLAFSFDELITKSNGVQDKILMLLIGEWHLYFYSSLEEGGQHKLWHNRIEIDKNSSLNYYYNNELLLQGDVNTLFNREKVVCCLNHLKTGNLSIVSFKKRHIHKNVFKVMITDSQLVNDYYDMASFGIFSRKELDESLVKKALGTVDEVMLRENIELENRINELYIESRF